jgi:preprotein translocase subunit SecG
VIYFVSTIHVLLCVFMIFVILLQPGKDAGMGAALGGGAATSAFGGRGAVTFLGKVTAVCAIAYFITSLGLSFVGLKGSVAQTIAEKAAAEEAKKKPAEAPKPAEGAKPADGTAAPAPAPEQGAAPAPAPEQGAATPQNTGDKAEVPPTNQVQKPSDQPGTPVPVVPQKLDGTEGVPAERGGPAR